MTWSARRSAFLRLHVDESQDNGGLVDLSTTLDTSMGCSCSQLPLLPSPPGVEVERAVDEQERAEVRQRLEHPNSA